MGGILTARCKCGYERRELFQGIGMLAQPSDEVVWCARCRRHETVREDRLDRGCPTCHGDVELVQLLREDDEDGGGMDVDATYTCRLCGANELRFDLEGVWD